MTVLSGCSCLKTAPQRVSVFKRISTGMSKPKPRHYRKRRLAGQGGKLPEITINMANKGKSTRHFSPKPFPEMSQRITRLRSETIRPRDYRRIQSGHSSDDKISDANSAIASDNTTSSAGRTREAFMITTEQMAQILQEVLAKQKEDFKIEMEISVQRVKYLHAQQLQELSNQHGESSRHHTTNQVDRNSEVEENINVDTSPGDKNTEDGLNVGGGPTNNTNIRGGPTIPLQGHPKKDGGEYLKMKDLKAKSMI